MTKETVCVCVCARVRERERERERERTWTVGYSGLQTKGYQTQKLDSFL